MVNFLHILEEQTHKKIKKLLQNEIQNGRSIQDGDLFFFQKF
jgi:hypothetical protein